MIGLIYLEDIMTAKFAIIYGRTDFFAEDLHQVFVSTEAEVRDLATQFIQVIPDDPEPYLEDIKNWNPDSELLITHQDDDTFLFQCKAISLTTDLSDFNKFVTDFNAD
jgi:hypothetical protein